MTVYYGFPESARRRESWELLSRLGELNDLPWCITGDFNDIMSSHEKAGRVPQPVSRMIGFSNAVNGCGLQDLGMSGYPFMWDRSRGSSYWVAERLDRVFANADWVAMFSSAWVENVITSHSGHSMLITHCTTVVINKNFCFRFENAWQRDIGCRHIVAEIWSRNLGFIYKLVVCARELEKWGRELRCLFRKQVRACRDVLEVLWSRSRWENSDFL